MDWLLKARDYGRAVGRTDCPIAFLIGAGCSISSGAPTTPLVHKAFEQATKGRADGDDVRAFLEELSQDERQRILSPLFADLRPHIGYRCLAALGRMRRVHVLNLNWDPLVEDTCRSMGVPVRCVDIHEKGYWRGVKELPKNRGVLCLHLHGKLGHTCLYSVLETSSFTEEEQKFIRTHFWNQQLLIIGASLRGDTDIAAFLAKMRGKKNQNSLWFIGRHQGAIGDKNDLHRFHALGANSRQYSVSPEVDFDRVMLAILEEAKGQTWTNHINYFPAVKLPEERELVLIDPCVLRNRLDAPLLALVGEPRLGKTVLAHFLAHCYSLWSENPPKISRFDLPPSTIAALAGFGAASTSAQILILDDPFGSTNKFEENPELFPQLGRLFATTGTSNSLRVIVTSRRQSWHRAILHHSGTPLGMVKMPEGTAEWYRREDLLRLARENSRVAALIGMGVVRTPGAVQGELRRDLLFGGIDISWGSGDDLRETVELLQQFPNVGLLCSLVRLQDFCSHSFPRQELLQWAGLSAWPPIAETFLMQVDFEGVTRLTIDHPTTVEAVDSFLKAKFDQVSNHVRSTLYPQHSLVQALSTWQVLRCDAFHGDNGESVTSHELARWGADYFAAQPTISRLEVVLDHAPDPWALTEVAYEFVRLWDALPPGLDRRRVLNRLLDDRSRLGAYAVCEACLYLQKASHQEILAAVADKAWELIQEPNAAWEIALMFDGLMWRPWPDRPLPDWASAYLKALREDQPAWGLIRFLNAYHPEGFSRIPIHFAERDRHVNWSKAQAEFAVHLVKWHFIHQAYSRVLLGRLRILDKHFLCRTLHPLLSNIPCKEIQRLIYDIAQFPDLTGWAFHLGCNIGCVRTQLDEELLRVLGELLTRLIGPDQGMLTACLTYDSVVHFKQQLRKFFRENANREELLDILQKGIEVDGTRMCPPRFFFVRSPDKLFEELDIRWPNLNRLKVKTSDPPLLARQIWELAQPDIQAGQLTDWEINHISGSIENGDLRFLEQNALAARGDGLVLRHILDTYLASRQEMPLFGQIV